VYVNVEQISDQHIKGKNYTVIMGDFEAVMGEG